MVDLNRSIQCRVSFDRNLVIPFIIYELLCLVSFHEEPTNVRQCPLFSSLDLRFIDRRQGRPKNNQLLTEESFGQFRDPRCDARRALIFGLEHSEVGIPNGFVLRRMFHSRTVRCFTCWFGRSVGWHLSENGSDQRDVVDPPCLDLLTNGVGDDLKL